MVEEAVDEGRLAGVGAPHDVDPLLLAQHVHLQAALERICTLVSPTTYLSEAPFKTLLNYLQHHCTVHSSMIQQILK